MQLGPSELILNEEGRIYHLNLLPEEISDTIILVGDPQRVSRVSQHFDSLEITQHKREFITHTGWLKNKRISVLSTGIGTDNIDIVLNELDALVNIDLKKRTLKRDKKELTIVRIGTSGAIQPDIPVDSFLISEYAMGFDNLLYYYQSENIRFPAIEKAFFEHSQWGAHNSQPYVVKCDKDLRLHFLEEDVINGFTGSNVGFYGPQGRHLRLPAKDPLLHEKLISFSFDQRKLTNLEMETSAIYGLAAMMGHKALSLNAIIANRGTKEFSTNPAKTVDRLIEWTLQKLMTL
ncbi:nucleoside phosphorylase [Muriicola sp.]|uniref:nucleoside phosphorylase n=1 Tax=Muriicola sp. TaxID=2020856 RepID=UPI003C71CDB3